MAQTSNSGSETAAPEVVITRTFDAPRALVFKMWTDPKHLAEWWGPEGFTNPVCETDARPGGAILIHMRGPDGVVTPIKGVFHEIIEPERIVMTTTAWQNEVLNTITFTDRDGKTELTIRGVVVKATTGTAEAARAGMEWGLSQSLDRLARYVARA